MNWLVAADGGGRKCRLLLLLLAVIEAKPSTDFWFSDSILNPGTVSQKKITRHVANYNTTNEMGNKSSLRGYDNTTFDGSDIDLNVTLSKSADNIRIMKWILGYVNNNVSTIAGLEDTTTTTTTVNSVRVNVALDSGDTWKISDDNDDTTNTLGDLNYSTDMNFNDEDIGSDLIDLYSKLSFELKPSNTPEPLRYCKLPEDLGPIAADKSHTSLKSVELLYPQLSLGGWYKPPNCIANYKVAIIVPFRNRHGNLAIFLRHMHRFLMRQQLDYGIFVIEQNDQIYNFNRAKLLNVGFVEANKARHGGWQCFIFHDVDLLPLDERNLYSCPRQPRHMSVIVDDAKLKYPELFGGVSALTTAHMTSVNGFSNKYWGWGGEDDDMSLRLRLMKYKIERYDPSIARYIMLEHHGQSENPARFKLLEMTGKSYSTDGLSSLHYRTISIKFYPLYTLVSVELNM